MASFNGLGINLGNLSRLSSAVTRSISAENPTGTKGQGAMATEGFWPFASDLGQGWKVSRAVMLQPGEVLIFAEIQGPGAIQSMWFAGPMVRRECVIRIYWDEQEQPSVECPAADFFACGWGVFSQVTSIPIAVNPNKGVNSYWEMPFRRSCRMTIENRSQQPLPFVYQVNYVLTDLPEDAAYFHAQFRRSNPLPYKEAHTIVDGILGRGQYVGTAMAWGVNNNGWWGEGEIKFFMDGDGQFPTICGTGTEDYFGGADTWDVDGEYVTYTTPFLGMHQVIGTGKTSTANHRFSMYRWHIPDPIRFEADLKVTIQALGWQNWEAVLNATNRQDMEGVMQGRSLPLQDDLSSVALWYQTLPTADFPELPSVEYLEVD